MKFFNKKKPLKNYHEIITCMSLYQHNNAKLWCQRNSSKGKFFFKQNIWYFEFEEDAVAFKLKCL